MKFFPGYRSRAAFKLIQLNRRFGFLQKSQVCVDLCAAPGGWMQVAKQNMPVSSIVIGVDLYPIKPVPGCMSLVEDITTEKFKTALTRELKTWKADIILNDGAPNVGKNWIFDAYQQICLTLSAVKVATQFLRPNGWFVTKVFRSKDYNALIWVLKQLFKKVHATKPSASRKESAEIFVVCQGYKAPDKIDPRFLDAKYVFEELEIETTHKINLLKETVRHHKKTKAEGYEGDDVRKIMAVSEFIKAENGLTALAGLTEIKFDDKFIASHPKTTDEIKECCRDIKVLGRKELKDLLRWWKLLHNELYKKELPIAEDEIVTKVVTADDLDDAEIDEVDRHVAELIAEEERDARRKKKKVNKERAKLSEKLNLKMIIKGDEGPREDLDDVIFNLKDIKNKKDLSQIIDQIAPDGDEFDSSDDELKPKYVRYDKETKGDLYEDPNILNRESGSEIDSDEDLHKEGLAISEDEDEDEDTENHVVERNRNPLISDLDYRDKDAKRLHKAELWFEKDAFKNMEVDEELDEDFDLDKLTANYKRKGVKILGERMQPFDGPEKPPLGKKAKRRARHPENDAKSSSSSDSDTDDEMELPEGGGNNAISYKKLEKVGGKDGFEVVSAEPIRQKKVKLTEEELALGTLLVSSKKLRRDLTDGAWNRYMFNDENLPDWFIKDEESAMRKEAPVPKELVETYKKNVENINVRSLKKVMEAKARKKKRSGKRMDKIKKKAENILENADNSNQEKVRMLKK